jgi:hypothetical protein
LAPSPAVGTKFWQTVVCGPLDFINLFEAISSIATKISRIDLESAALIRHIGDRKPESAGQRELRVLWPLRHCNGFWLAPSAHQ